MPSLSAGGIELLKLFPAPDQPEQADHPEQATFYTTNPDPTPQLGTTRDLPTLAGLIREGRAAIKKTSTIIPEILHDHPDATIFVHLTICQPTSNPGEYEFTAHVLPADNTNGQPQYHELHTSKTTPTFPYPLGFLPGGRITHTDLFAIHPANTPNGAQPLPLNHYGLTPTDITTRPHAQGLPTDPHGAVTLPTPPMTADLESAIRAQLADAGITEHDLTNAITQWATQRARDVRSHELKVAAELNRRLNTMRGSQATADTATALTATSRRSVITKPTTPARRSVTAAAVTAYEKVAAAPEMVAAWIQAKAAANTPDVVHELEAALTEHDKLTQLMNDIEHGRVTDPSAQEIQARLADNKARRARATQPSRREHDLHEKLMEQFDILITGEQAMLAAKDLFLGAPELWALLNAGDTAPAIPGEQPAPRLLQLRADAFRAHLLRDLKDPNAITTAIRNALINPDGVLLGVLTTDLYRINPVAAATSQANMIDSIVHALLTGEIRVPALHTRDDFAGPGRRRPRPYDLPDGSAKLENYGLYEQWAEARSATPADAAAAVAQGQTDLEQRMRDAVTDHNPHVFACIDLLRANGHTDHILAIASRDTPNSETKIDYIDPTPNLDPGTDRHSFHHSTEPGPDGNLMHVSTVAAAAIVLNERGPLPAGQPRGHSNTHPLTPRYRALLSPEQKVTWEQQRQQALNQRQATLLPSHRAVRAISRVTEPPPESWRAPLRVLIAKLAERPGITAVPGDPDRVTVTNPDGRQATVHLTASTAEAGTGLHAVQDGPHRYFVVTFDAALGDHPAQLKTAITRQLDTIPKLLTIGRIVDALSAPRWLTLSKTESDMLNKLMTAALTGPLRTTLTTYIDDAEPAPTSDPPQPQPAKVRRGALQERRALLAYIYGRYPDVLASKPDQPHQIPADALARISDITDGTASAPLCNSDLKILTAILGPLLDDSTWKKFTLSLLGSRPGGIATDQGGTANSVKTNLYSAREIARSYIRGAREAKRMSNTPAWPDPLAAWLFSEKMTATGIAGLQIPDTLIHDLPAYLRPTWDILVNGGTYDDVVAALGCPSSRARAYAGIVYRRILTTLWDERITPWSYQTTVDQSDSSLLVVPPYGAPFRIPFDLVPVEQIPGGATAKRVWARPTPHGTYRMEISDWAKTAEKVVIDGIVTEHIRMTRLAELRHGAAPGAELADAVRLARAIARERVTLAPEDRPTWDRLLWSLTPRRRELLTRYAYGAEAPEIAAHLDLKTTYTSTVVLEGRTIVQFALSDRYTAKLSRSQRSSFRRIAEAAAGGFTTALSGDDQAVLADLVDGLPGVQRHILLGKAGGDRAAEIAAQRNITMTIVEQDVRLGCAALQLFFAVRGIQVGDAPAFTAADRAAFPRIAAVLAKNRQTVGDEFRDLYQKVSDALSEPSAAKMWADIRDSDDPASGPGKDDASGSIRRDPLPHRRRVLLASLAGRYPLAVGGQVAGSSLDVWLRGNAGAMRRLRRVLNGTVRGALSPRDLELVEALLAELERTENEYRDPSQSTHNIALTLARGLGSGDILGLRDGGSTERKNFQNRVTRARAVLGAFLKGVHEAGVDEDHDTGAGADAEAISCLVDGVRGVRLTTPRQWTIFRSLLDQTLKDPSRRLRAELWADGMSSSEIAAACGISDRTAVIHSIGRIQKRLRGYLTDPQATLESALTVELRDGHVLIECPGGTSLNVGIAAVPDDLLPADERSGDRLAVRVYADSDQSRIEVSSQVDTNNLEAILNASGPLLNQMLAERSRTTRLQALVDDLSTTATPDDPPPQSEQNTDLRRDQPPADDDHPSRQPQPQPLPGAGMPTRNCVHDSAAFGLQKNRATATRTTRLTPAVTEHGVPSLSAGGIELLKLFPAPDQPEQPDHPEQATFYTTNPDPTPQFDTTRDLPTLAGLIREGRAAVKKTSTIIPEILHDHPDATIFVHLTICQPTSNPGEYEFTAHALPADNTNGQPQYHELHTSKPTPTFPYPLGFLPGGRITHIDLFAIHPANTPNGAQPLPLNHYGLTPTDITTRPNAKGLRRHQSEPSSANLQRMKHDGAKLASSLTTLLEACDEGWLHPASLSNRGDEFSEARNVVRRILLLTQQAIAGLHATGVRYDPTIVPTSLLDTARTHLQDAPGWFSDTIPGHEYNRTRNERRAAAQARHGARELRRVESKLAAFVASISGHAQWDATLLELRLTTLRDGRDQLLSGALHGDEELIDKRSHREHNNALRIIGRVLCLADQAICALQTPGISLDLGSLPAPLLARADDLINTVTTGMYLLRRSRYPLYMRDVKAGFKLTGPAGRGLQHVEHRLRAFVGEVHRASGMVWIATPTGHWIVALDEAAARAAAIDQVHTAPAPGTLSIVVVGQLNADPAPLATHAMFYGISRQAIDRVEITTLSDLPGHATFTPDQFTTTLTATLRDYCLNRQVRHRQQSGLPEGTVVVKRPRPFDRPYSDSPAHAPAGAAYPRPEGHPSNTTSFTTGAGTMPRTANLVPALWDHIRESGALDTVMGATQRPHGISWNVAVTPESNAALDSLGRDTEQDPDHYGYLAVIAHNRDYVIQKTPGHGDNQFVPYAVTIGDAACYDAETFATVMLAAWLRIQLLRQQPTLDLDDLNAEHPLQDTVNQARSIIRRVDWTLFRQPDHLTLVAARHDESDGGTDAEAALVSDETGNFAVRRGIPTDAIERLESPLEAVRQRLAQLSDASLDRWLDDMLGPQMNEVGQLVGLTLHLGRQALIQLQTANVEHRAELVNQLSRLLVDNEDAIDAMLSHAPLANREVLSNLTNPLNNLVRELRAVVGDIHQTADLTWMMTPEGNWVVGSSVDEIQAAVHDVDSLGLDSVVVAVAGNPVGDTSVLARHVALESILGHDEARIHIGTLGDSADVPPTNPFTTALWESLCSLDHLLGVPMRVYVTRGQGPLAEPTVMDRIPSPLGYPRQAGEPSNLVAWRRRKEATDPGRSPDPATVPCVDAAIKEIAGVLHRAGVIDRKELRTLTELIYFIADSFQENFNLDHPPLGGLNQASKRRSEQSYLAYMPPSEIFYLEGLDLDKLAKNRAGVTLGSAAFASAEQLAVVVLTILTSITLISERFMTRASRYPGISAQDRLNDLATQHPSAAVAEQARGRIRPALRALNELKFDRSGNLVTAEKPTVKPRPGEETGATPAESQIDPVDARHFKLDNLPKVHGAIFAKSFAKAIPGSWLSAPQVAVLQRAAGIAMCQKWKVDDHSFLVMIAPERYVLVQFVAAAADSQSEITCVRGGAVGFAVHDKPHGPSPHGRTRLRGRVSGRLSVSVPITALSVGASLVEVGARIAESLSPLKPGSQPLVPDEIYQVRLAFFAYQATCESLARPQGTGKRDLEDQRAARYQELRYKMAQIKLYPTQPGGLGRLTAAARDGQLEVELVEAIAGLECEIPPQHHIVADVLARFSQPSAASHLSIRVQPHGRNLCSLQLPNGEWTAIHLITGPVAGPEAVAIADIGDALVVTLNGTALDDQVRVDVAGLLAQHVATKCGVPNGSPVLSRGSRPASANRDSLTAVDHRHIAELAVLLQLEAEWKLNHPTPAPAQRGALTPAEHDSTTSPFAESIRDLVDTMGIRLGAPLAGPLRALLPDKLPKMLEAGYDDRRQATPEQILSEIRAALTDIGRASNTQLTWEWDGIVSLDQHEDGTGQSSDEHTALVAATYPNGQWRLVMVTIDASTTEHLIADGAIDGVDEIRIRGPLVENSYPKRARLLIGVAGAFGQLAAMYDGAPSSGHVMTAQGPANVAALSVADRRGVAELLMADLWGGAEGRQMFAELVKDWWWDQETSQSDLTVPKTSQSDLTVEEARDRVRGYLGQMRARLTASELVDINIDDDLAAMRLSADDLRAITRMASVYSFFELPAENGADSAGPGSTQYAMLLASGELLRARLVTDSDPGLSSDHGRPSDQVPDMGPGIAQARRLARLAMAVAAATTANSSELYTDASHLLPLWGSGHVATGIKEALQRAASGQPLHNTEGEVTDNDGQPFHPERSPGLLSTASLRSLPVSDSWTAWVVPVMGREKRPNFILIDGDPRDPETIYYWADPDGEVRMLNEEQLNAESNPGGKLLSEAPLSYPITEPILLYARSRESQLPESQVTTNEQPASLPPAELEHRLVAATTPADFLNLPKPLRVAFIDFALSDDPPPPVRPADEGLARVCDRAQQILEDIAVPGLSDADPSRLGLGLGLGLGLETRVMGRGWILFRRSGKPWLLLGLYQAVVGGTAETAAIWVHGDDIPCVLIAVDGDVKASEVAGPYSDTVNRHLRNDQVEYLVEQRLFLVTEVLDTFGGDVEAGLFADAAALDEVARIAETADWVVPPEVGTALTAGRAALESPQDSVELSKASRQLTSAASASAAAPNDRRHHGDPDQAAAQATRLIDALDHAADRFWWDTTALGSIPVGADDGTSQGTHDRWQWTQAQLLRRLCGYGGQTDHPIPPAARTRLKHERQRRWGRSSDGKPLTTTMVVEVADRLVNARNPKYGRPSDRSLDVPRRTPRDNVTVRWATADPLVPVTADQLCRLPPVERLRWLRQLAATGGPAADQPAGADQPSEISQARTWHRNLPIETGQSSAWHRHETIADEALFVAEAENLLGEFGWIKTVGGREFLVGGHESALRRNTHTEATWFYGADLPLATIAVTTDRRTDTVATIEKVAGIEAAIQKILTSNKISHRLREPAEKLLMANQRDILYTRQVAVLAAEFDVSADTTEALDHLTNAAGTTTEWAVPPLVHAALEVARGMLDSPHTTTADMDRANAQMKQAATALTSVAQDLQEQHWPDAAGQATHMAHALHNAANMLSEVGHLRDASVRNQWSKAQDYWVDTEAHVLARLIDESRQAGAAVRELPIAARGSSTWSWLWNVKDTLDHTSEMWEAADIFRIQQHALQVRLDEIKSLITARDLIPATP